MAGYGTDAGFEEWLTANGLVLPADSQPIAVLRQRGSTYVDATYGARLLCSAPTDGIEQERAWPRRGHLYNNVVVPSTAIPRAWVTASYRAAWLEATAPGSLSSTVNPANQVRKNKVDVIEQEFFEPGRAEAGNATISVVDAEIEGLVTQYLCQLPSGPQGLLLWAIGP